MSRMKASGSASERPSAPQTLNDDPQQISRDALITDNLSVVGYVARKVTAKLPPSIDPEDIHSAGVLGLMDAAEKYDPSRGVQFRTYAAVRVHGAMVDYLRSLSWAPRGLHRRAKEIDAARTAIEQRTCGLATVSEIATELEITIDECHLLLTQVNAVAVCSEDDTFRELQGIAGSSVSSSGGDPLMTLEWKSMLDLVWQAVENLPERQKLILWLYYYEELTMKEVGAVLKVNEARVSQLHSKAIASLQQDLNGRLGLREAV